MVVWYEHCFQTDVVMCTHCDKLSEFCLLSLQAADLSKPIDKRIYKGTQPTCHDFNHLTATAESVSLLVGFSAGQVQLIDPIKKETSKLFNEEVSRNFNIVACNVSVILKCLDFQSSVDVAPFACLAYCSVTAFVFQLGLLA